MGAVFANAPTGSTSVASVTCAPKALFHPFDHNDSPAVRHTNGPLLHNRNANDLGARLLWEGIGRFHDDKQSHCRGKLSAPKYMYTGKKADLHSQVEGAVCFQCCHLSTAYVVQNNANHKFKGFQCHLGNTVWPSLDLHTGIHFVLYHRAEMKMEEPQSGTI